MTTSLILDKKAKQRLKQEALASWTAHQETWLQLTGKEVCEWIDSWGMGEEMEVLVGQE